LRTANPTTNLPKKDYSNFACRKPKLHRLVNITCTKLVAFPSRKIFLKLKVFTKSFSSLRIATPKRQGRSRSGSPLESLVKLLRLFNIYFHREIFFGVVEADILDHVSQQVQIVRQQACFDFAAEHIAQYSAEIFMPWI